MQPQYGKYKITNSVKYGANMLESDVGYKFKLKYIHKYNANKNILVHININSMRRKSYSLTDQVNPLMTNVPIIQKQVS